MRRILKMVVRHIFGVLLDACALGNDRGGFPALKILDLRRSTYKAENETREITSLWDASSRTSRSPYVTGVRILTP